MIDTSKLPVLDNITTLDQLKEYVYKLEKQVKFLLENIDEENLSADLVRMIKSSDGSEALQTAIEQNSKSIALKASKKTVDSLGAQVKENNAALSVQANEISAIVEETSPGVYTLKRAAILLGINGDGSYTVIKADNISLEGYTTVNENFKILLDGSIETVNATLAGILNCIAGNLGGLSVNGDSATMLGDFTVNGNLRVTGTAPSTAVTPAAVGLPSHTGEIVTIQNENAFGSMPKNELLVTDGNMNYRLLYTTGEISTGGGSGSGGTSATYIAVMQNFSSSVSLRSSPTTNVGTTGGHLGRGYYYLAYANTVTNDEGTWYQVFSKCTLSGTVATLIPGLEASGWALLGSSVTKVTGVTI